MIIELKKNISKETIENLANKHCAFHIFNENKKYVLFLFSCACVYAHVCVHVRTPTLTLIHTLRNEGEKCVMSL